MYLTTNPPSRAFDTIRQQIKAIKVGSQHKFDLSAAGTLNYNHINNYITTLRNTRATIETLTSTPGLLEYAQAAYPNDVGYDPVAEYQVVRTALDNVIVWIINNLPKDENGYELGYTRNANGSLVPRVYTAAATTTLRAEIQSLIDTIE